MIDRPTSEGVKRTTLIALALAVDALASRSVIAAIALLLLLGVYPVQTIHGEKKVLLHLPGTATKLTPGGSPASAADGRETSVKLYQSYRICVFSPSRL